MLPQEILRDSGSLQPIPSGAERDRTVDLRLAKPALSQLSYSPGLRFIRFSRTALAEQAEPAVGQGRLELPTSRLSGVRSNHLSYWPGSPAHEQLPERETSTSRVAN